MGQCKVCGKSIADDMEYCEDCQPELQDIDLDAETADIDFSGLDDYDLPELSGDLFETNLEFELTDPANDLENPDIIVREKEPEIEEDIFAEVDQLEEEEIPELNSAVTTTSEEAGAETADASVSEEPNIDLSELESIPDLDGLSEPMDIPQPDIAVSEESADLPEFEDIPMMDETPDIPSEEDSVLTDDLAVGDENLGADDLPVLDDDISLSDVVTEEEPMGDGLLLDSDLDALLNSSDDGMDLSGLLPEDDAIGADVETDAVATDDLGDAESSVDALLDSISDGGLMGNIMGGDSDVPEDDFTAIDDIPEAEALAEVEEEKPKISIWKRLFGNLKDEKWKKAKEKEAQEEEERLKKEAEAKEAEKAAGEGGEGEGEEGKEVDPKEAKKAEKLAKKQEKARLKEERKAEKARLKELAQQEEDEDQGRINRVGATIVFVFLGLVCAGIIVGTNAFSYKSSVRRAEVYFKEQQYTEAYNQLAGLAIEKKDMELYQKVRTVMYVNKELNSYYNYTNLRLYAEALDSLLKGLEKYDVYSEDAIELEVIDDLDKLRNKILDTIENEYNLTEDEAYKLIQEEDQAKYSKEVIDIANQD
ncbi:MAG: hypothetical protein K5895_09440 [Lachnospiraceae bacterium]|nr:hypothetical protein [Lachnospiraceae bacterium]